MSEDFEVIDPRFATYVLHNATVERLATGFRWTEGPVWFGDAATLLFSDIPNNRIMRWIDGVGVSTFREPADFANGHTRDREGRLITCSHGRRAVLRTERNGDVTVLADTFEGKRLNSPNDVVVRSDGSIWFSDPHYGIVSDYEGYRAEQELPCNLYRLDPVTRRLTIAADDFAGPNGLAFSPDERRLYVADTGAAFDEKADRHIRVFDVDDEGQLSHSRIFHAVSPGAADGFRCDEDGNLWTSAGDGVHCLSPEGVLLGKIRIPETVANLTFGGRSGNRLFICASTSLYSVFLNRRGALQL